MNQPDLSQHVIVDQKLEASGTIIFDGHGIRWRGWMTGQDRGNSRGEVRNPHGASFSISNQSPWRDLASRLSGGRSSRQTVAHLLLEYRKW
jgi:hypothetical protein